MDSSHEQRVNVKFCYKLGKTFTETFDMIKLVYVMTPSVEPSVTSGSKGSRLDENQLKMTIALAGLQHQQMLPM